MPNILENDLLFSGTQRSNISGRKWIFENISKNLSGKCSKKRLDHAKKSVADPIKTTLKRVI